MNFNLKELYGVRIPEYLQETLQRAREYTAGFLYVRNLPIASELETHLNIQILKILKGKEVISGWRWSDDPLLTLFREGVSCGESHNHIPFNVPKTPLQEEHEPDGLALMQRASQNPDFIPIQAWPSREDRNTYNFAEIDEE